jgi:hypothetical protein
MFHGRHHISMLPGVHVGVMSALLHLILLLLIIIMMLLGHDARRRGGAGATVGWSSPSCFF